MSDPFVAEIKMFAGNFAPNHYALCAGQLLPISQNTALFSLLGTFYGGDGKSTFALPNLMDSAPVGQGQSSASGSQYFIGQQSGVPYVTLIQTEMPVHTHTAKCTSETGDLHFPAGNIPAVQPDTNTLLYSNNAPGAMMGGASMSVAGGSQPHNNMMPSLAITFIIALQGVFPARN